MGKKNSKLKTSLEPIDEEYEIIESPTTDTQIQNVHVPSADVNITTSNNDPSRSVQLRIIENYMVVWLDANINSNNENIRNSITRLRRIVLSIHTFSNADECIDFLTDINNENIFLIISDSFAQHIVPLIEGITRLESIYIFRTNESNHQRCTNKSGKVKGMFTQIEPLCDVLKEAINQYENDLTPISIVTSSSVVNPDELDQSFMYSQLVKEIILGIEFDGNSKKRFIDFCRVQYADNNVQLNAIDDFERNYEQHSPVWWYTKEPFIYSTLNKALRTQDLEIIIRMGFFIQNLHHQIDQLHCDTQETTKMIFYRGQGMTNMDFEKMKKSPGGLLSFNNFLSSSIDREVSLVFADSARGNPDLTGILFQLEIDRSITSVSFAPLDNISYFSDSENEVLFSMHTVFRIGEMKEIEDRLWQVDLILTNDNDQHLKNLTDYMRKEIGSGASWDRLAVLLIKMGEFEKAAEVMNILFDTTSASDQKNLLLYYAIIGDMHRSMGNYFVALSNYEKALETKCESSADYDFLYLLYNKIGLVHQALGKYSTALSYYEKTLEITQKYVPPNFKLSSLYNNIATVYTLMGNYSAALVYLEKTLEMQQKSLPSNHPDLATGYNNIGSVHQSMGNNAFAVSFYEKTLEIQLKSLPPNHPELASGYNNVASVYQSMGYHSTALSYLKKTLQIQQISLPSNHPDLARSYNNIALISKSMGYHSTAVSYLEQALEITQKSLPSNHPNLAFCYNNIASLYQSMGYHSTALSYFEKTLDIQLTSLPSNHPDLAVCYNNIASLYQSTGYHSTALSYFEKALGIQQMSLPSEHPSQAFVLQNIGDVHRSMGDYLTALPYFEKALEIQQKSSPSNYLKLADAYSTLGELNQLVKNYSTALSHFEKVLDIQQKYFSHNLMYQVKIYVTIGMVYQLMKKYSTALSYFEKALDIQQKSLPPNRRILADIYLGAGLVHQSMQKYSTALSYYEKVVEIEQESLSPDHFDLSGIYIVIGSVHQLMKKYSVALSYFEKVLNIQQKSISPNYELLINTYIGTATVCVSLRRIEDAVRHARQAVHIAHHVFGLDHSITRSSQSVLDQFRRIL